MTAEFTAAYNLLIYLSNHSPTRDMLLARICQYLSEQPVTSSAQFGSSLALTTLTTIFNTLPSDSDSRYHVFMAILKVIRATSATQAFETLTSQLRTNVPKWLADWQLDDEDARQLHIAIADVAAASGNNDMSFEYLLLALDTIPPDQASGEEAQKLAKRTLTAALTNPSITDFTPLTQSDAIQGLRKSEPGLFDLLEVFSADDYSAYLDFLQSTPLSSLQLDSASQVLETKIRLLTLATTAANAPNRSVPYSEIAEALQVPLSDVEIWVIDTIRAGLVEGKLSQMKQEFLVQRATYRVFGDKQWAEIQGRLMVWRRSLESVLGVIKSEREKFAREGPGGFEEQQQQQQPRTNGYGGGDRRQGGGRMNRQPREVDFAGE